ncbi:MAG TPA: hypothetical protein VHB79_35620 [Polyangiaceae bacterium]|nr:hypothetical protein [Polyangiaceae bacterium]
MRAVVLTLLMAWGCSEPVHEREVEELGPESPGVAEGPLHRAGQPCGTCHGELGPARRAFSLSGTVYHAGSGDEPEPKLTVRVLDTKGAQLRLTTNDAGSFFLPADEYAPAYPLWIKLERGEQTVEMHSAISRETSCAGCHGRVPTPDKVGQVYFEMPGTTAGGVP